MHFRAGLDITACSIRIFPASAAACADHAADIFSAVDLHILLHDAVRKPCAKRVAGNAADQHGTASFIVDPFFLPDCRTVIGYFLNDLRMLMILPADITILHQRPIHFGASRKSVDAADPFVCINSTVIYCSHSISSGILRRTPNRYAAGVCSPCRDGAVPDDRTVAADIKIRPRNTAGIFSYRPDRTAGNHVILCTAVSD